MCHFLFPSYFALVSPPSLSYIFLFSICIHLFPLSRCLCHSPSYPSLSLSRQFFISLIVCFLLYLYSHLFLSLILHFYFSVCSSFHSLPFFISVIHPLLFISLFISFLSLHSYVLSCHSSSPFNFCVCFSFPVAANCLEKPECAGPDLNAERINQVNWMKPSRTINRELID